MIEDKKGKEELSNGNDSQSFTRRDAQHHQETKSIYD